MQRINNGTQAGTEPTPTYTGAGGYFQGGINHTKLDQDWCNRVQEEIVAVATGAGASLDATNNTQMITAINALIAVESTERNGEVVQIEASLLGEADNRLAADTILQTNINTVTAAFANDLAAIGYQKLYGGLIIQWGVLVDMPSGGQTVTFPITFPNACINVTATNATGSTPPAAFCGVGDLTTSNFFIVQATASESAADDTSAYWMALGF